nr:hypothetical protein [Methylotetracoccus sp.]
IAVWEGHKYTKEEIWFFVKAKPYFIDEDGNYILDLHIGLKITNNESLKEYDWSFSYTKDNGKKVTFKKDHKDRVALTLTRKEKEVAKWLFFIRGQKKVIPHRGHVLRKLELEECLSEKLVWRVPECPADALGHAGEASAGIDLIDHQSGRVQHLAQARSATLDPHG